MGFHENLIQSFENFKNVFLGSTDISSIGDGTITSAISTLNEDKQDALTFDSSPTSGSNNPVTSGGVYTALQNVDIDVDSALSSTSENPVQNKVITSALGNKQDTLTQGTGITISNGVISAQSEIDDTSTGLTKTWSASKIKAALDAVNSLKKEIVNALPTQDIDSNTIYLVPKATAGTDDVYDEYLYINNNWEHLGDTSIDLSNYYTSSEVDDLLDAKEDTLTFDTTPTQNSTNPVTSGGVYTALQNVDIDVDDEIDSTSTNPVQNQVIAAALDDKQDTLIAGSGIEIDEDNVIKTTGATIYANPLYPSGE